LLALFNLRTLSLVIANRAGRVLPNTQEHPRAEKGEARVSVSTSGAGLPRSLPAK
jgi:hypothetical protein